MDPGAQPTAEILPFKPYRLIEEAPAWADMPAPRFPGWVCVLIITGLASGVWAILWGLIEFLKAMGV